MPATAEQAEIGIGWQFKKRNINSILICIAMIFTGLRIQKKPLTV